MPTKPSRDQAPATQRACRTGAHRPFGRRTIGRLRTLSAVAVGIVVLGVATAGYLAEHGVQLPAFIPTCLHGVCPLGGVATVGRLLSGGLFVPRTSPANLFALAATLGTTLFAGAFFCGWLCPLGALQEWMRRLGRRIGILPRAGGIPFAGPRARAVDRALGWLRYGTLLAVLVLTFRSFNLVFASVDPFYALFHFWTGAAMPAALAVLGATLLASLFVERPWCRWLCPYGAVQGLVQKVAPWKVRRDPQACVGCGACDRACPMNIAVSVKQAVTDDRCNRCLSCIAACPKPGALQLAARRPRLAVRALATSGEPRRARRPLFRDAGGIAAIVVIGFLLPLAAGTAYRYASSGQGVADHGAAPGSQPEQRQVATAGAAADAEQVLAALSGSLSLEQAAALVGVKPERLLEVLGLPGAFDLAVKLRDLEEHDPEKTYRWVRARLEALLREQKFTQHSPVLRELPAGDSHHGGTNTHEGGAT